MPRFSETRGSFLLTVDECAHLAGKSRRTIQRYLTRPGVHVEYHMVPHATGATNTAFVDPLTIPVPVRLSDVVVPQGTATPHDDKGHTTRDPQGSPPTTPGNKQARYRLPEAERHNGLAVLSPSATTRNPCDAKQRRLEQLQRVLVAPRPQRARLMEALAKQEGVSQRTTYRWVRELRDHGANSRASRPRADMGRPRIPKQSYDLIVAALVSNPPSASVAMVHRTLLRAVPDGMSYVRGGRRVVVSRATVGRVRAALASDPATRGLFLDADAWLEFQRVYSGEVVSAHANDMWQMDMTRCDVMVVDAKSGAAFRPRVHAVIDVYSGCVPGLAFSREEDQTQTDLALLRALLPKGGPFAEKYPVFGVPRRMYWDNGKTYRSFQAERIMAGLGVQVINSRPGVRHSRGRIERFFGTLHGFERSLPGYVGVDAVRRSSLELRRLVRGARRWLESGRDPGFGERLLTVDEFQSLVLAWLVVEYHAWVVDGKSRLEHFLESAPAGSRVLLDRGELMLLFASRVERGVEANGNVRVENRRWTIPDGSLVAFAGRRVLVLRDQFAMADDRRLIAWRDRHGRLEVLGEAVPAPSVAESVAAGEDRRRKRAVAAQVRREAVRLKRELSDPSLRVASQVLREAEVMVEPVEGATAQGRLGAVRPVDPRERLDCSDPLTRFLLEPGARLDGAPEDPVERAAWFERRGELEGDS